MSRIISRRQQHYGLDAAILAAALLLAGCGLPGGSDGSKPFMGKVDLAGFSDTCKRVQCWLPTQFQPKLVAGESVSLKEQSNQKGWPLSGDPIKVLCVTKGAHYQDSAGQPANDWYGVVIPTKHLDPDGYRARKVPGSDDRLAYVPVYLVRGGEGKEPPVCPPAP